MSTTGCLFKNLPAGFTRAPAGIYHLSDAPLSNVLTGLFHMREGETRLPMMAGDGTLRGGTVMTTMFVDDFGCARFSYDGDIDKAMNLLMDLSTGEPIFFFTHAQGPAVGAALDAKKSVHLVYDFDETSDDMECMGTYTTKQGAPSFCSTKDGGKDFMLAVYKGPIDLFGDIDFSPPIYVNRGNATIIVACFITMLAVAYMVVKKH